MVYSNWNRMAIAAAPVLLLLARAAAATDFVYVPLNPAFGGNGAAGQVLLSTAQATNKHKAPVDPVSSIPRQTALEQFNDMLQRAVLGQLAAATTSGILGPNGKLKPGTVETNDFRIAISDQGGGVLSITTTDKSTGGTTTFQIGGQADGGLNLGGQGL